jgi:C1A family cysteine protease
VSDESPLASEHEIPEQTGGSVTEPDAGVKSEPAAEDPPPIKRRRNRQSKPDRASMPVRRGAMIVIDTNDDVSGKLSLLQKKGVAAIGRYYSSEKGKRISPSEAEAVAAAGLKLFMVFEDNGDPPLGGNAGSTDAKLALEQARAIGQPAGSAIYFAMEHLPNGYTSADLPGVKAYFQQIQAAFQGKYKIGVYSDGVVCDALLTSRLCDYAWLSASMGFEGSKAFYLSGRWSLAQQTPLDQNWSGLSVDTNEAKPTFGEFVPVPLTTPEPAVAQAGPAAAPQRGSLGWKPDVPDHRDYPYTMRLGIEAPAVLPPSVDLRSNCPPVYQQGKLNSCTANAIAAAFEFLEIKGGNRGFDPSRLFIYYNERKLENTTASDSGAYLRDGIKCIASSGICTEANWPYDLGKFADAPPDTAFQAALTYKALSYFRLNNANINELKSCLAAGFPFVFGFAVYDSFYNADGNGGIVSLPGSETLEGGHAVLAVGYDDANQRFTIQNSWGTAVGDNGYYYMPYQYLTTTQLADDFWTVRSVSGPSDATAVTASGAATAAPSTPSVATAVGLVAPGAGTFTVQHGKRYQATVTLNWFEQQVTTNEAIAGQLAKLGFSNVVVTGTGATRQAAGTWTGADTTEQIDPHLSNIVEVA